MEVKLIIPHEEKENLDTLSINSAALYEQLFKSQQETIAAKDSVIEAQRLQIAALEAQLRQQQ